MRSPLLNVSSEINSIILPPGFMIFFNLLFFKACCIKSAISIVLINLLSFVSLLIKVARTEDVVLKEKDKKEIKSRKSESK